MRYLLLIQHLQTVEGGGGERRRRRKRGEKEEEEEEERVDELGNQRRT